MNLPGKDYLGDGVYVEVEDGMLKVTTEDGVETSNIIFFEPEVFQALVRFTKRVAEVDKRFES